MSTRSTTHFVRGDRTEAIVYRHPDGYPEGHGRDLRRFFAAVENDTQDTRYNDPSYLAAKLVVWLAREFAQSYEFDGEGGFTVTSHADKRPLDFISVGVVMEDPGDIEYRYIIHCDQIEDGRPVITCWDLGLNIYVPIPSDYPSAADVMAQEG